ncbi:MAG TPA: ROK family transcriptional regulator [Streptosporangiaceae bacterium]|jgi:glucokinase
MSVLDRPGGKRARQKASLAAAAGEADAAVGRTLVPADVRLANLARIVREMRSTDRLSRADVARRAGVSLPTAHRLVSDLAVLGLVEQQRTVASRTRLGRPPVVYSFREDAALLAGIDAGNEWTRLALTTLSGRILAERVLASDQLGRDLAETLGATVATLLDSAGQPADRLAGAAAGVAACVDGRGVLRDPPVHQVWDGLPLRERLSDRLGCEVAVAQDDHLSSIAESSERGTFPGATSLLVLEIGRGIGAGMTIDGKQVAGARGRFGRIAGWPVTDPVSGQPSTLGDSLVSHGLARQYQARGGTAPVTDGAGLADAARLGDPQAQVVLSWAAEQIADVVTRLHRLCDPQAIVIGGGLARAYDLLEPELTRRLAHGVLAAPSILGERAVVLGAEIVAGSFVESWLSTRLARA